MQTLIESEINHIVESNKMVVVNNADDLTRATEVINGIKGLQNKVKESYDPIVGQAHMAHKEAITQRDKYLKPLQEVEKKYKSAILTYHQRLEAEQRERERIANERLAKSVEEQKAKLIQESQSIENEWEKEVRQENINAIKPITVNVQKKVIEQEGLTIAQNWKFEVIDEDLIPREYMVPDELHLSKLAKTLKDKANVPGVRFYNAGSVRV